MTRGMLLATAALLVQPALAPTVGFAKEALVFAPIAAPADDAAKRAVTASPEVTVDGASAAIGYRTLLRTGQKVGSGVFGQIVDVKGQPILGKDGAAMVSPSTDFSSILEKDGQLYIVSHFETRPAAVYVTKVTQGDNGMLTAVDTQPVDFSADWGLWVPCAGSVTPWGTHLGSEEYEPDAAKVEGVKSVEELQKLEEDPTAMAMYFGFDPAKDDIAAFRNVFNPYAYGYITEIALDKDGKASAGKHYAMGRFAHELGTVMPDQKTVYLSDDGTNVGLYRFVADQPGKLDAGTLYAAKWHQTSADNGGAADLSWVDLGHADDAAVKALVAKGTKFADIFETAKMADDGTCPAGFGGSVANGARECLKVKDGMELAASRLETRRYAALKGATVELRKEEGNTYDADHNRLYVAISEISNGMEDKAAKGKESAKYDVGGANDIKVAYNPCGGVYALDLDQNYVATNMKAFVVGKPHAYADGTEWAGNTCDMDGLANPDNISYLPGRDTLFIGEDTGTGHQNDAVWSYNVATGALTRILTTPYGAESTSVYAYPDVNGHGYVMAVVQHPYGESDTDKLKSPDEAQAYLGYIGPFPKLD
jgi:secreted PhoX family phosphatase